jgi:hypothetical protein
VLFQIARNADYFGRHAKRHPGSPDGEEAAETSLGNSLEHTLREQVRVYFKHKRNAKTSARPCATQSK